MKWSEHCDVIFEYCKITLECKTWNYTVFVVTYVALWMRSFSCFSMIIMTARPPTPLIYSMKFLVFNFLGCDFLVPKRSHCHENQPEWDLVYKSGFVYVKYTLIVSWNEYLPIIINWLNAFCYKTNKTLVENFFLSV